MSTDNHRREGTTAPFSARLGEPTRPAKRSGFAQMSIAEIEALVPKGIADTRVRTHATEAPVPTRLEEVAALLRGALAAATNADDVAALALARRPSDTPVASAVLALDARAPVSPFVAAVLRAVWQACSFRAFHVPSTDAERAALELVLAHESVAEMRRELDDLRRARLRYGLVRLPASQEAPAERPMAPAAAERAAEDAPITDAGAGSRLWTLAEWRNAAERVAVREALARAGTVRWAAELLGLTRRGLQFRMVALGMREAQADNHGPGLDPFDAADDGIDPRRQAALRAALGAATDPGALATSRGATHEH
jgi:hypothetical protein